MLPARLYDAASRDLIPLEVTLELTSSCNFACPYCYLAETPRGEDLDSPRITALLDELSGMGTLMLVLSGGEPLLRPDWLEIARHARQLGMAVSLLTNGSRVDRAAAAALAGLGVTVHLSLPAATESTGRSLTGVAGGTVAAVSALRLLAAQGVRTVVRFLATTIGLPEIEAVRDLAAAAGANFTLLPTVHSRLSGSTDARHLRVPVEDLREAGCWRPCRAPDDSVPTTAPPCGAGRWHACVRADGRVTPCPLLPTVAGDLRLATFREIWTGSPVLARLRAVTVADLAVCKRCGLLASCNRCHGMALLEGGDALGPDRRACELAGAGIVQAENGRGGPVPGDEGLTPT
ncbi:MAG: radical SAM/SPASM domain-containing protein [Thermoanaerobaculaceae bacterium]